VCRGTRRVTGRTSCTSGSATGGTRSSRSTRTRMRSRGSVLPRPQDDRGWRRRGRDRDASRDRRGDDEGMCGAGDPPRMDASIVRSRKRVGRGHVLRTRAGDHGDRPTRAAASAVETLVICLGPSWTRPASRAASSRPARQPGARPPGGGWIRPGSRPALASNHEITEFEFHMSPVWPSSRPQTRAGTDGTRSRICEARVGSCVSRTGLETASAISGMTPSRHRRTSYRKSRKRLTSLAPTAPSTTTPRRRP